MAPLFCPTCVEKVPFSGGEALRCHLARMHFQCLPYPCTSCRGEMKCPTEASLRHHMEFEHGVQEYMVSPFLSVDSHNLIPLSTRSRSTTPRPPTSSSAWPRSTPW